MKDSIAFGSIQCARGKKVQGIYQFSGTEIESPMTIINGWEEGKTVLLTSGIHGGEYPGIEGVLELAWELQPEDIRGALVIFHPVNVDGFLERVSEIYPGSGENLNRQYPGSREGTIGQRFAAALTYDVIQKCDFMIDTHGGDLHELLLPHVYYPGTGDPAVIKESERAAGMVNVCYRICSMYSSNAYHMCSRFGIPGILIEMGGRGLWSRKETDIYKANIKNVLKYLQVLEGTYHKPENPSPILRKMVYIKAGCSGCWYPAAEPGQEVCAGQLLGTVKDFFGNTLEEIYAEFDAVILCCTVSLAIKAGEPVITYGN